MESELILKQEVSRKTEIIIYKGFIIRSFTESITTNGNTVNEINSIIGYPDSIKRIHLNQCNDGSKFNSMEHARNQAKSFVDSVSNRI